MPTLPLYTPNAIADASHRVVAPGGYELWHFDAESSAGDIRLIARLGEGDPFQRDYLPRYLQYRRRPTRWPPPLPAEYPAAHVAVYEGERLLGQFTTQCPPDQFSASAHRPQVKVEANEFVREQDGAISLRLRGTPARESTARDTEPLATLSAQLTFRPILRDLSHDSCVLPRRVNGDAHHWVVAETMYEVSGTISLGGRDVDFRGLGYHDHTYGTGPLPAEVRHWVRGRLIRRDRLVAFYLVTPLDRHPAEARLIEADAAGARELPVASARTVGWRPSKSGHHFPQELHIASREIGEFTLTGPRPLEPISAYTRLTYSCATGPYAGSVLCELLAAPIGRWRAPGRAASAAVGEAGIAAIT
jgi:hypothetical protein